MGKLVQLLLIAGAIGAGGHFGLRYYLRSAVKKELENNKGLRVAYEADNLLRKGSLGQLSLNLPPVDALVESVVPLNSFISPYDAADDIGKNGRMSKYWPEGYERGSLDPKVERDILKIFSNMAAAGKKKELAG